MFTSCRLAIAARLMSRTLFVWCTNLLCNRCILGLYTCLSVSYIYKLYKRCVMCVWRWAWIAACPLIWFSFSLVVVIYVVTVFRNCAAAKWVIVMRSFGRRFGKNRSVRSVKLGPECRQSVESGVRYHLWAGTGTSPVVGSSCGVAPLIWELSVVQKIVICPVAADPTRTAAAVNCSYCCRRKDPQTVGPSVISTVSYIYFFCLVCSTYYCIFVA